MKKCIFFCITLMLLATARVGAQDSYNDRAKKYIEQYSPLAILEQKENGIPAAITLGQGILETEAGASVLMTDANNHFGIKCGNGWMGETFSHTDDAPDECFKKYKCVQDSYRDHSEHLKRNPRYAHLFTLSKTDYASWAVCLKKCGYATNPQYAQRLIKIIEDFKLQEYTYSALDDSSPVDYPSVPVARQKVEVHEELAEDTDKKVASADTAAGAARPVSIDPIKRIADSAQNFISHLQEVNAQQAQRDSLANAISNNYQNSKLVTVNGLKAFYAYKDEMLLQYAIKFNVRYPKLLEMNDLPDAPLAFNTYVYVEKKLASGTHTQHAVKEGETLLMISQVEGMQIKRLQTLNMLGANEEPAAGSILSLQFPARRKPALAAKTTTAPRKSVIEPAGTVNAGALNTTAIADKAPVPHPVIAGTADEINTEEEADTAENIKEPAAEILKGRQSKAVSANGSKAAMRNEPAPMLQSKPVATAKTVAGTNKYYTVKKGDTAFSIARRNEIPLDELMQWNHINDGGIKIGQTLRVKE